MCCLTVRLPCVVIHWDERVCIVAMGKNICRWGLARKTVGTARVCDSWSLQVRCWCASLASLRPPATFPPCPYGTRHVESNHGHFAALHSAGPISFTNYQSHWGHHVPSQNEQSTDQTVGPPQAPTLIILPQNTTVPPTTHHPRQPRRAVPLPHNTVPRIRFFGQSTARWFCRKNNVIAYPFDERAQM